MENDHARQNDKQGGKKTPPRTSNVKTDAKSKGAKKRNNQSNSQKWSLVRHWKVASRKQQIKWISRGIGIVVGLVTALFLVLGYFQTQGNFEETHKPIVVNIRPPKIQFFACNPSGTFVTGNIVTAIRNVGTATADDVNPFVIQARVVPDQKTGNKFFDDPPAVAAQMCKMRPIMPSMESTLYMGDESGAVMRQSVGTIPFLTKSGQLVSLYLVACVYYSEESGVPHGTCDRYRLYVPGVQKPFGIDNLLGTSSMACDGAKITGVFVPDIGGHCEE